MYISPFCGPETAPLGETTVEECHEPAKKIIIYWSLDIHVLYLGIHLAYILK